MTTDINRAKLLETINLLRPAIATADYIPTLTHIQFDGEYAMAYNDISAVSVLFPTPFRRCIPGDLLAKAAQSMLGEKIATSFDPKSQVMLLASGRSKIKVPTLPHEDFPFALPDENAPELDLTADMVRGIELCLAAVGADKTHPEQCGVTLASTNGLATLYSTDGMTISRYETDEKIELPGDSPIILPTFFCERIVALHKASPKGGKPTLVLYPGALLAEFGLFASVYSKTLVDLEPVNFERPLEALFPDGYDPDTEPAVPTGLDAAIDRALLVTSREVVRTTTMTVKAGTLSLHTSTTMGDADDDMSYTDDAAHNIEVKVNPEYVARALKTCDRMALMKRAAMFTGADGKLLHVVAAMVK